VLLKSDAVLKSSLAPDYDKFCTPFTPSRYGLSLSSISSVLLIRCNCELISWSCCPTE